jgi:hypothetical protein
MFVFRHIFHIHTGVTVFSLKLVKENQTLKNITNNSKISLRNTENMFQKIFMNTSEGNSFNGEKKSSTNTFNSSGFSH